MKNDDEKLYAEEVRKILHISKRKCAWMLQNGMIPCQDTGKKTHRYIVLKKDLHKYINDSKQHPEKYIFPISFTSEKTRKRKIDNYYLSSSQVPENFNAWLDDEWYNLPDVISPKDIERILGYHHETIRRWINRGWLKIVRTHNEEYVPREWLIDFTCDHGFRIAQKSVKHRKLLDRYLKLSQ